MTDLITAYSLWRDEPFPTGSTRDDIDAIHAELVTVDLWMAEIVFADLEFGKRSPIHVDVKDAIQKIRDKVQELLPSATQIDADKLEQYDEYASLMQDVFDAFLAQVGSD